MTRSTRVTKTRVRLWWLVRSRGKSVVNILVEAVDHKGNQLRRYSTFVVTGKRLSLTGILFTSTSEM